MARLGSREGCSGIKGCLGCGWISKYHFLGSNPSPSSDIHIFSPYLNSKDLWPRSPFLHKVFSVFRFVELTMTQVIAGTSTFASLTPLQTPFWDPSPDPNCGQTVQDPTSGTAYCCDGLLIDITQPIAGQGYKLPFYFQNLRCCWGIGVAQGDVTSCGGAIQMMLTQEPTASSSSTSHFSVTIVGLSSHTSMAVDSTVTTSASITLSGSRSSSTVTNSPSTTPINASYASRISRPKFGLFSMILMLSMAAMYYP